MIKFKITQQLTLIFLSFFAASGLSIASEYSPEDEEMALLALLDDQTEIATKTKINADFVPGMVTILSGEDLERKGIHTVWQALGTIPGMEVSIDQIGNRVVKVRGIGGSFASGNLKIMLNQVAMNSALTAQAQPILNMPIEQIERIEIIRGPGSAVYGEHAYAGVVNVISKKTTKSIFAGAGGNKDRIVGGTYVWDQKDNNYTASLNMAFSKTDGEQTYNATDALLLNGAAIGMSQAAVSNAPGSSNEDRKYKSILFNFNMSGYDLKVQWLNDSRGDYFGTLNVLPADNDGAKHENEFKTIDLSKKYNWSNNITTDIKLGWLEYSNEFNITLLPEGFGIWHFPSFPLTLDDGYLVDGYYKEDKFYAGMDLFWNASANHSLLFGFNYSETNVKDAWQQTNVHPNGSASGADDYPINGMQTFHFDDGLNWPSESTKRKLTSITLQDEYQPLQSLLITAGLRYDDYSDVGNNLSPRIAAVYHLSEKHILKGQYAEAFRPPTFYESAWSPDLDPQTINTFDLGYIYKGTNDIMRLTLFHSKLNDVISAILPLGFENSEGATIKGVEFELSHAFNTKLSANFNLSYAKSKDDITGEPIPRTSNWLSNLDFRYQPTSQYDLALRYHYVGKQYRELNDPREKLDAYGIVDITANFLDFFSKGTTIQLGIDNLFDEDVRYPAPMATDVLSVSYPSYEDDYPREGRRWWLRLKYQFD
jgi:outer membrane receptor for ferrienterochelin and colicin